MLFPERPDDLIDADNPVRVIDAFVDSLDLKPWIGALPIGCKHSPITTTMTNCLPAVVTRKRRWRRLRQSAAR